MKNHTSGIRAAVGVLAAMVAMSAASAEAFDWKSLMTVAERQRDDHGKLLPLQSYDETIRRGMSFILDDHLKWFKGPAGTLVDKKGKTQMPWVYYSNLQHNGAPFPRSVDRFVSYPAFHHSLMIRTLIGYWRYAKDDRAMKEAMKLADWNIAHSTPADWAYGNLPYSTFQEKKPGGFRDKTGLMPDKAAIMALAYLQLHKASGEARFLAAAEAIGHTLSQRQRPNGTWPFRVDPKTEVVIEEYTSSVIYAVMLFESLDENNGNNRYKAHRDLTWNWLLNGPIKTKEFRGFYEDIPASPRGRTNYDCLDTIRYLLANRTDRNGYLELAKNLNLWIEKTFLDKIKGFEPAEGIREQLQCNVVMGIHSLNWASMLRELAEATGDEKMRQRAIQTANYITYYLQPDNRIVVGFQYQQWWYSCHTGVVLYLFDFVDNKQDSAGLLRLENKHIAVQIDRETGAVRSMWDKDQDIQYPFSGIGFDVTTETGSVRPENAVEIKTGEEGAELRFTAGGLEIRLFYSLGPEDRFIEKWLEIKSEGGKPYVLKSVVLEDMRTEAFSEIHFHDDQTIWHCPINLFLRSEKGGCFAGLEYPYWDLKQNGNKGFRLGYQPNYQAAAGETNVSEKYFIGVYRKEGIHRVSQGPYPGRGRYQALSWGGKAGLVQHFKSRRIPPEVKDVPLETLDWGEVWAMQKFMRHVLPDDLPLPEEGYWVWQNGWWAGLWNIKPGILDQLKQAGVHDVMTAHTWYGRGNHPISPPYIDRMRAEPMGFPKDSGVAGMPGPAGPAAGLHAKHDGVQLDKFTPGEFTSEFLAPPAMEAFYQYGKKIGVHVSSFSLPCVYFQKHPEWASIDETGKVSEYLFGRKVSCPACDPYMDHMLNVLDHVFTKYKPRWWGFDGRWLSYWEVPYYRPGPKGLGFDTCHAKDHGHLPGDNLYKEWKNIQNLVRELRRRHPNVCLEAYLGLKRGGPWALRYFNCDDNYYETNGALLNRFQTWHNQNDRFRPPYKNYAAIFGTTSRDFQTSLISTISATSYCQIGPGFKGLALEENREFLKKWRAWASRNHGYLKVKRDLFDCPGDSPVDGSAHIIKGRGFLFLFPVGSQSVRASIPVNRWLQLEENPDALYRIKEIYPGEGTDLGVYKYGDEFLYDMPQDTPVVLALEPAPAGSKPQRLALQNQPERLVVPAFGNSTQQDSADPAAHLHRHYTFDTLIEKIAATPDASPHQAHARLSGQELCEGVIGKALQFKAGNNGVVLGDLGLQAPATLCFWLKTDSPQADGRILSQLEGPTTQNGSLRLSGKRLTTWNVKGWPIAVNGLINKDVWQHVAIVFREDGAVTGYLNGKKANTFRSAFDFKGVKAGIGARFIGEWGTPFVGALDDFRIYSSALKESEIKTMYPPELFSRSQAAASKAPASKPLTPLGKLARDEYLTPVRPGKHNEAPFWNQSAHQFMYAPSFNFSEFKGASRYRFTARGRAGQNYVFDADKPYAALAPIWLKIPIGPVQLKVEALDAKGQVLKVSGERKFHRAAMYNGPYHEQLMGYQQSAQWGLRTLFNRDDFKEWMKPDVPPEDYRKKADHKLYWGCPYPSKLMGAIVAGAALYANITPRPDDADEVLSIGRKAADYLISLHLRAGTPMEFFPPTYDEAHAKGFMVRKNVMMNYPGVTAEAYLDFYDVTKEKKYFEAAKRIANTHRKLQLPEGTWYQVIDNTTGKGTYPTLLNPVKVIRFADRLVKQYGLDEYSEMRDKAFGYLMGNTMKTFNWQSQFEDAAPNPPYRSLSPAQACEFADYLLGHREVNPEYVELALELMRFAEDQFVTWENPKELSLGGFPNLSSSNWITPCVSEQHQYMMPVNFSSSNLIETFLKAYQATGNKTCLAKSQDLANTLLLVQKKHRGEYPTYLVSPTADGKFEKIQNSWINCGVYTIRSVMRLSEALKSEAGKDSSRTSSIINGTDWYDIEGRPIQAHDGHITRVKDTFYWYGSSYAGNPKGMYGTVGGYAVWNGIQVYSSKDLVNWAYRGVALPRPKKGWGVVGSVGRAHVIYNEKTRKYVMWYWYHTTYPTVFVMVATSNTPVGPFKVMGAREVGSQTGFGSDLNVFKDDDGKAYLVYTDHHTYDESKRFDMGKGVYAILVDSLTDDYLDSNKEGVVAIPSRGEAPAMARHKGKYIVAGSGVNGWAPTETRYVVADSPLGPYGKPGVMTEQKTWGGQITSFLHIKESDTLMAMCDQWWTPDKTDLNKSRYLWLPVDVDPQTGVAKMTFHKKWNPLSPLNYERGQE